MRLLIRNVGRSFLHKHLVVVVVAVVAKMISPGWMFRRNQRLRPMSPRHKFDIVEEITVAGQRIVDSKSYLSDDIQETPALFKVYSVASLLVAYAGTVTKKNAAGNVIRMRAATYGL